MTKIKFFLHLNEQTELPRVIITYQSINNCLLVRNQKLKFKYFSSNKKITKK